jgi:hypothetical protein
VCKDPHTQPNLLFVANTDEGEREREKKSSKEKVINPGIIPVINNLWLVGYLEIYNYFCITASIFLTALVF